MSLFDIQNDVIRNIYFERKQMKYKNHLMARIHYLECFYRYNEPKTKYFQAISINFYLAFKLIM